MDAIGLLRMVSSDKHILILLEGLIFLTLLYAVNFDLNPRYRRKGIPLEVTRGEKSRTSLATACTLTVGFLAGSIVAVSSYPGNHKVVLILFNSASITYLCLFNSWCRNKIIGWVSQFEKHIER